MEEQSVGAGTVICRGVAPSCNSAHTAPCTWPLSPAQAGMFYQTIAHPHSGCYIEQVVCHLHEKLDVGRLVRCWQDVLERHSIMRTCFQHLDSPEPGQFVHEYAVVPCQEEDWRSWSTSDQQVALAAYLACDRERGFDLLAVPLMRLAIFRLEEADFILVWTVHHLIVDGRSINLLLREVFGNYDGPGNIAVPEEHPFGLYAASIASALSEIAEVFWRERLAGIYEATRLPLPRPASGLPPSSGHVRYVIDPARTAGLEAFAADHALTLNTVLLGAWALLAHRYGDTPDVVLGATKTLRHGACGVPDGIGPYINTLPIRTTLNAGTAVVEWLKALRAQWVALREFEHTPSDHIRACCDIPGDESLFNLYYVFERETLGDALHALGGAWHHRDVTLHEHTPVPLILAAYGGESILLSVEFDTALFVEADIARLMQHLLQLLNAMVASPQLDASSLALLPREEVDSMIRANRNVAIEPVVNMTPALFEAAVLRDPEAIALRFLEESINYGALNRRANQLARHLRGLGVATNVPVGMCMAHTPDSMVALLGILKAGGVYVPMDPAYPADRLDYTLRDSGAPIVITDVANAARFRNSGAKIVPIGGEASTLDRYSAENLGIPIAPQDLAYIIYTSGSTGHPKGVCVAHGEAAQHFVEMVSVYRITPADRTLQFASLSFDVSLEQIFAPLLGGSTLHIADESMYVAPDFSAVLREAGITVLNLPPAFWQQWVDEGIAQGLADFGAAFRLLIVGGDVVLPRTVRQWQACSETAGVLVMNAYGPTETVITALYYEVPANFDSACQRDHLPIGRPIRGAELYVLDRFQNPLPAGLPGELYIGGNRLAKGYHNRPDLTARSFVPHPLDPKPGSLLYRTGDRVRQLPDGDYEFLGRLDDQVKIRGFRIELREIEMVLVRSAGVREAVVRRREDRRGEGQLVAYLVPEQGKSLDLGEIRDRLRTELPDYMIPAGFVLMDAFPVTVNGKVDYKALPELEEGHLAFRRDFVPPATRTQRIIAEIWREVLECGEVSIADSFFDLGGHSLRAARVITRIRSELNAHVALGDFLQSPTIAALARLADGDTDTADSCSDPCIVELQAGAPESPLLFCVLGAGGARSAYGPLSTHLGPGQTILALQYSHLPEYRQFTSVESVAQRYLVALKSRQPHGPYFIAGWSFGGLVAYELARHLVEAGETVALLAIIDCEARLPAQPSIRRAVARVRQTLLRFINRGKIVFHTRDTLLLHGCDIARLIFRVATGQRRDGTSLREYLQFARSSLVNAYAMKQAGLQPAESRLSRLDVMSDEFVKKVVAGLQANEHAAKAFSMKPCAVKVTLFRTGEGAGGFGKSDRTLGYGKLVDQVDVVPVDGNHFTLVKEPYVRLLAERLAAAIAAARAVDPSDSIRETG